MPSEVLKLSEDQAQAIDAVQTWWRDCTDPDELDYQQTFSLAGYAGTGKTTVISRLLKEFRGQVLVGAPTGKAAQRLREKGVLAQTIHALAYKFTGYDQDGDPEFDYVGMGEGRKLVVIDEASMVNDRMYHELLEGGYAMLFVGDHGQLPPVGGDPGLMRNPDFTLSVIHRQDDEGLLDFAHLLRQGQQVPMAWGAVEALWIPPSGETREILDKLSSADITICWRNQTRHWLNHRIMQLRGLLPHDFIYDPKDPATTLRALRGVTFPVVCLRNNHRGGVFNGEIFNFKMQWCSETVLEGELEGRKGVYRLDVQGFRGLPRGYAPPQGLFLFDFGCAITAHKSQGSEWPWVCVWDDYSRHEDRDRWAYTAATRAEEKLTWLYR